MGNFICKNSSIKGPNKLNHSNEKFDSLVYLNNRLLESYSYMFSKTQPTKALILSDTIIDNGKRLGKNILKVEFHTDSTVLAIRSESEFVKDTTFMWKDTSRSTLVLRTIYYTTLKTKKNNELLSDFQLEFIIYQAEKIGAIRVKIPKTVDNKIKYLDLVEIRN